MAEQLPRLKVDNTMGAALVGVIFAAMLYGVSCVQTWYYFTRYRKDHWGIKLLVASVFTLDTAHQLLITHTVYYYIVTNFARPTVLGRMVWSILLEVICNGLIGLLVQSFLVMRVFKLSERHVYLCASIMVLVLAGFACSLAFTATSMQLETWAQLTVLKGLSMSVNVLCVVPDVLIATSLFYYLRRSRTGFKKSDTMISRLILFVVSTGLLTSICAVCSLTSILLWGDTLIYVAFYFSLGRLYGNSLLATLNARIDIRGLSDEVEDFSFSIKSLSKAPSKLTFCSNRDLTRPSNLSLTIDTVREYTSHLDDEISPSTFHSVVQESTKETPLDL